MKRHLTALVMVMLFLPTLAGDITKPGYIINLNGDTLWGKVLLRETKKGYYDLIELFVSIKFQDTIGNAVVYHPGQIQGFGYTFGSDSSYIHFRSFSNVEMKGTFGKTTIAPYLKDRPEDNLNEVPKEMPIPTLFMVFSSYNLWWALQHKL